MATRLGPIETLNRLAGTVKDAEEGYRTAADGTDDSSTKEVFHQQAQTRAHMAEELHDAVRRLGGQPELGESLAGMAYRGWVNLKSILSRDDSLAMLEECERGEDYTIRQYKEALDADLPGDVRPLVERQFSLVRQSHDQIKSLRDARRH